MKRIVAVAFLSALFVSCANLPRVGVIPIDRPDARFKLGGGALIALAWSADGSTVAAGGKNGFIATMDADDPERLNDYEALPDDIMSLAFFDDGRLAAACADGYVRILDREGNVILEIALSKESLYSLDLHSSLVVSGGQDGLVRIWDLEGNRLLRTIRGHEGPVNAVQFYDDGQAVVSGSEDGTIRFTSVETGRSLLPAMGFGDDVYALSITGDRLIAAGKAPASEGEESLHFLALYQRPAEGQGFILVRKAFSHTREIWTVRELPGMDMAYSSAVDGRIQLWSLPDMVSRRMIRGEAGPIWATMHDPEQRFLYSVTGRGYILKTSLKH